MNKKGITLIELLTTLIIMGIIAVITTPIVLNSIESFKRKSFKTSVDAVIQAIRLDIKNVPTDKTVYYRVINGTLRYNNRTLETSGSLNGEGTVIVDENGKISLAIKYDKWCASRDFTDQDVIVSEEACNIPIIPSLIDYSWMEELTLNTNINNVDLTGFPNQPTTQGTNINSVVIDTNPWGKNDIIWKGNLDAGTNYEGGFYIGDSANTHFELNNRKNYRISIWVKNTGTTGTMLLYNTGTFTSQISGMESIPYTDGTDYSSNAVLSTDTRGEWILLVGYLYQYGSAYEATFPYAYRVNGTQLGSSVQPRKMTKDTKFGRFRTMRYNASDGYGYFYRPRIDLIDGNEPTIADLLAGIENSNLKNE